MMGKTDEPMTYSYPAGCRKCGSKRLVSDRFMGRLRAVCAGCGTDRPDLPPDNPPPPPKRQAPPARMTASSKSSNRPPKTPPPKRKTTPRPGKSAPAPKRKTASALPTADMGITLSTPPARKRTTARAGKG